MGELSFDDTRSPALTFYVSLVRRLILWRGCPLRNSAEILAIVSLLLPSESTSCYPETDMNVM